MGRGFAHPVQTKSKYPHIQLGTFILTYSFFSFLFACYQNLESINARALTLNASSAASSLSDIASDMQTVSAANTSYVHPAGLLCDSYTPAIQTLENRVTEAIDVSNMATSRTTSTAQNVQQLMTEVQNIGAIDTAALQGLQTRIQAAQQQFTAGEYAQVITGLKQGLEAQGAWLMNTQAEVRAMRDQIDALDSFRVQ